MAGEEEQMGPRKCGQHCPEDNVNHATTKKCRMCKKSFHLPCYDVIEKPSKLFIVENIVFLCDDCLEALDNESSPERKRKSANNSVLRQSMLSPSVTGSISLSSNMLPPTTTINAKKCSNEKLYSLMSTIADKLDKQSNKIDEIGQNVCTVGNDVIATKKKTHEAYDVVFSRLMLREQQDLRDLSKEMFRPNKNDTFETPNGTKQNRVYPKPRTYSTVVQSTLPVTPQPTSSEQRKRVKTISLIENATGETLQTAKFPSPKQGKKNVELGKPIPNRQLPPRKSNPFTKSVWISRFHPETTPDEIENYITEHTEAKDKTKFKCVKLVKKDQDVTQMSFVSFKIDTTPEVFDILINPENWPQNKSVREFIRMSPPKPKLEDFVPLKAATSNESTSNANGQPMEIQTDPMNQNASSSSNSINNVNGSSNNSMSPSKNV